MWCEYTPAQYTLQHTTTLCNTTPRAPPSHTRFGVYTCTLGGTRFTLSRHRSRSNSCNTLQHVATYCNNTLQHIATYCNNIQQHTHLHFFGPQTMSSEIEFIVGAFHKMHPARARHLRHTGTPLQTLQHLWFRRNLLATVPAFLCSWKYMYVYLWDIRIYI